MPNQPIVFLDRDGTINVDDGYVHRIEQWQVCDGAIDALRQLASAGFGLAIVTNQSGIGAGLYSSADVDALHAFMQQELAKAGVRIDAIAFCPHAREVGCACRKPAAGMLETIRSQLKSEVDLPASWMIGDKPSDIGFGEAIGVRTVLLRSQYWNADEAAAVAATYVCDSLAEATVEILSGKPK